MTKEPEVPLNSGRKNRAIQWFILILALVIIASVIVYHTVATHRAITVQEQQQLLTQSRVICSNMNRSLESADLVLQGLVIDLPHFTATKNSTGVLRRLKALTNAMPGIRTLLTLDEKGIVLASSREEFIGKDFSSRNYYQVPRDHGDVMALYVSPPFKSILGPIILNLSRIIPAVDGSFGGVVVAALDPSYLGVLLSSVRYAPDLVCTITHGDGLRFMVVPERPELVGKNQDEEDSFFFRHKASSKVENIYSGKSVSTGEETMVAIQTVRPDALNMNKPLYVFISRRMDAIYAPWRQQLPGIALFFFLLCTVSTLGLKFLQRRQRQLEEQAQQIQALVNMRLGLLEYAATHDMHELLQQTLDEVCRQSKSPIGFYHFVEADQQTLSLQAWSTRTLMEFCTAEGSGLHYPIKEAGVWADCIRQRRPVLHNNYGELPNKKGLPEGHAPLIRELVVPIFRGEKVVAILGIGNKSDDYSEQDVELVSYLADVAWEITERKRGEEERQKLGVRYQTLQSVSRDGIHILDEDGNLVESNGSFRQMLGYDPAENLQLNVAEWDAGIPVEELTAKVRELIHAPAMFESKHRRRDGTIFDVEISACGVQLDGKWYLYASSRDISNRKEMEATLRESRQRLADIFDFLPDPTFVVDQEKKVVAWNRAMEEMSGVSQQEMLGQGDNAYSVPFYGERRNLLIDLLDADDGDLNGKYQHVTRQGERLYAEVFCPALYSGKGAPVWAVGAPLYDSDGKRIGAIETIRDITAIKEIETNLARSNRELEQFAYIASHDLQEPLRKIAGFTELLASRYKGTFDEKGESYMDYIVDGATRMRTLINDMLSYSRIIHNTRELAETDCSKVVSKVLQDMELSIKENKAEIVCGPLPVIQVDKAQLGQLFQNLIANAIRYHGAEPPRITINATCQQNEWLFSVSDNGIGIAPEFYQRIFAIFQRLHTRAEYPGTGIGLAICQKIVERHGGKIWVESKEGSGSTFFFTLPTTPNNQEKII
ncbi:MAG: GAF domain-containing protein [Proteobacteria bacterium]|nr:GAF domain-containing protein [Pseudomonadota bacterium]MBU1650295.1 GAF domain-containing protein [Pseudomonadota bacterium]